MSSYDVYDRVSQFYDTLIPLVELGHSLNTTAIGLIVKEAVLCAKSAELETVLELQGFETASSCKTLLLALFDNIRVGKKQSDELLVQLQKHLGYRDVEYETATNQRTQIREEFLDYCTEAKTTQCYAKLKGYLKLLQLTRLRRISSEKFNSEISHLTSSESGNCKLIQILSLPQAKLLHNQPTSTQIVQCVQLVDLLESVPADVLLSAVRAWPTLGTKVGDVIIRKLALVETGQDLRKVGASCVRLIQAERALTPISDKQRRPTNNVASSWPCSTFSSSLLLRLEDESTTSYGSSQLIQYLSQHLSY